MIKFFMSYAQLISFKILRPYSSLCARCLQIEHISSSMYRMLSNLLRSGAGSCRAIDAAYDLLRSFLSLRAGTLLSGERVSHFSDDTVAGGVAQMDVSDDGTRFSMY